MADFQKEKKKAMWEQQWSVYKLDVSWYSKNSKALYLIVKSFHYPIEVSLDKPWPVDNKSIIIALVYSALQGLGDI